MIFVGTFVRELCGSVIYVLLSRIDLINVACCLCLFLVGLFGEEEITIVERSVKVFEEEIRTIEAYLREICATVAISVV
jgi:hypothetical protein